MPRSFCGIALLCLAAGQLAVGAPLVVDRTRTANTFDGIGGLSGGGATSVLLPDYAEPSRTQILDYLFKPNFGASLQILKVEIGGDSQSTDGTESSHMHDSDTVDLHTGYEWWLMQEAKKRNPEIKLYGLAWAFPGWVGSGSGDPFKFPEQTARYLVEWVNGAKSEYGLDIDYLGIWNERSSDSNFVQVLRKQLNAQGHTGTKLVVKDGDLGICEDMVKDKAYADAVDIVGLHYPSDYNKDFAVCKQLGKPIWASEESSSLDDLNGAACWARVVNSHWVINQMTSSIMWNLVGAYYHGTNWYASSMMTSVEPWSGHYDVAPVIWATAHITQFTKIGWQYLANGFGSGELPHGGYYSTWVDPSSGNFTMNIVKISWRHGECVRPSLGKYDTEEETLTFLLAPSMRSPETLELWYSNFEPYGDTAPAVFQHSTVQVKDNKFTLKIPVGAVFTVTTVKTGHKGGFQGNPPSSPSFPLDHTDDFQSTPESRNARWFADQIGSFETHLSGDGKKSLKQMVPQLPIGWADHGSRGPMTLIGMREFQDIKVKVAFKLPSTLSSAASRDLMQVQFKAAKADAPDQACVGVRVDQMWVNGVVLCIDRSGHWQLAYGGPPLAGSSGTTATPVRNGTAAAVGDSWHTLSLEVWAGQAEGLLDGASLFSASVRDIDTGFAAIGASGWFPIEFRNFSVSKARAGWDPPSPACAKDFPPSAGAKLSTSPCSRNGMKLEDQEFDLLPSYQMRHSPSGLCASATTFRGPLTLETCNSTRTSQTFTYPYSLIRNQLVGINSESTQQHLMGDKSGAVFVGTDGDWKEWTYFPNTKQLRNQYVATAKLGYPMCLSSCPGTDNSGFFGVTYT